MGNGARIMKHGAWGTEQGAWSMEHAANLPDGGEEVLQNRRTGSKWHGACDKELVSCGKEQVPIVHHCRQGS